MTVGTGCSQPTLARLSSDNILGADAKSKLLEASRRIDAQNLLRWEQALQVQKLLPLF